MGLPIHCGCAHAIIVDIVHLCVWMCLYPNLNNNNNNNTVFYVQHISLMIKETSHFWHTHTLPVVAFFFGSTKPRCFTKVVKKCNELLTCTCKSGCIRTHKALQRCHSGHYSLGHFSLQQGTTHCLNEENDFV